VKLWDPATGQELRTLSDHTDGVEIVAFSPDGRLLASGSDDRTVIVWDVAAGQVLHTLTGEDNMTSVAFSPDGRRLASAEVIKVKLWDVATWEPLRVLEGNSQGVERLIFSPDGKTLISGSGDTTIKLWDLTQGE
jgi:WD40 repeat protein